MNRLERTTSENSNFQNLVVLLDQDLRIRDAENHSFYNQFNKTDAIKHAVLFYEDDMAVGCGAFREKETGIVEIKRMFVHPKHRKKGIASKILLELEKWAAEENFTSTLLETGKNQPEAISLYQKLNYKFIPNYPPYEKMDNSICMKKNLK